MPLHDWTQVPSGLYHHHHILVPLESTYQATWAATPEELRRAVETGVLPQADAD